MVGEGSKGRASERWQGRFHVCFCVPFICSSIVCTLHDSTEPESCSFEKEFKKNSLNCRAVLPDFPGDRAHMGSAASVVGGEEG